MIKNHHALRVTSHMRVKARDLCILRFVIRHKGQDYLSSLGVDGLRTQINYHDEKHVWIYA